MPWRPAVCPCSHPARAARWKRSISVSVGRHFSGAQRRWKPWSATQQPSSWPPHPRRPRACSTSCCALIFRAGSCRSTSVGPDGTGRTARSFRPTSKGSARQATAPAGRTGASSPAGATATPTTWATSVALCYPVTSRASPRPSIGAGRVTSSRRCPRPRRALASRCASGVRRGDRPQSVSGRSSGPAHLPSSSTCSSALRACCSPTTC
jgi:hypothetical protein